MALTVAFNKNFHTMESIFLLEMFQISITILFSSIITLFYGLKSFIFQNLYKCKLSTNSTAEKKKSSKEKIVPYYMYM